MRTDDEPDAEHPQPGTVQDNLYALSALADGLNQPEAPELPAAPETQPAVKFDGLAPHVYDTATVELARDLANKADSLARLIAEDDEEINAIDDAYAREMAELTRKLNEARRMVDARRGDRIAAWSALRGTIEKLQQ